MKQSLDRLLNPRSIALFGGAWAENVVAQLVRSNYQGDIWPVHPTRQEMQGIKCFASLSDLPGTPDAGFIGVNRNATVDIVRQLSELGAGGAACFASGFLESEEEISGGGDLQAQLVSAAGDMPILGPNCYGMLNYIDGVALWPDQHGGQLVENGVAIIGQSSNILINITMHKRGLPISYVIAAGNQAQTGISEIGSRLLEDDRVTALGLYIEGFGDIRKLEQMAEKARQLGKPIVAIKIGKSQQARAATLTHTASLAGNAVTASAFLKRLGIIEVDTISVMLETLKLLHICGPLAGNAICSLSCSGGEAGLMADVAHKSSIEFRPFSESQQTKLKSVLGPMVTIANPLDYHTYIWDDEEQLYQCYRAALEDNFDLVVLVMDLPHDTRCDGSAWQGPLRAIKRAKRDTGANVALLTTLPENLSEEMTLDLIENRIVPINGLQELVPSIEAAIAAGRLRNGDYKPVHLADQHSGQVNIELDEETSKSELAKHGLNSPRRAIASSSDRIADACSDLKFPVVLKGLGIAHKSEQGAVVLNLETADAVANAVENMDHVSGFLVEEMVPGAIAELLIGITRDPTGMFTLTVGAGGVLTELLGDTVSLIVPANRNEIRNALKHLKVAKILDGFRGKPAADMNAIVTAIEAVQTYCLKNKNLIELDVNPLMALEKGAIAVDALIITGEEK